MKSVLTTIAGIAFGLLTVAVLIPLFVVIMTSWGEFLFAVAGLN